MSHVQSVRLAAAAFALAAVQVAAFDRFLLFGVAYLAIPLFLAIAVGGRMPFTNAVVVGAGLGFAWDLLSIDLFGRYALALALAAGLSSLVQYGPGSERTAIHLRLRRFGAVLAATGALVAVSAAVGETLPIRSLEVASGVAIAAVIGTLLSGSPLRRLAMPGLIAWDPAPVRSTDWMDRRAGLYSVPATAPEREAA